MGIFSESKVYVASVPYNLAGPEKNRPQYLKSTVISNIIGNANVSMGDTINHNYLNGPGIRFRQFSNWCESSGYNTLMGITNGVVRAQKTVNPLQIPVPNDEMVWDETEQKYVPTDPLQQMAIIGPADPQQFFQRWMWLTRPGVDVAEYDLYPTEDGTPWRAWHIPSQTNVMMPAPPDWDPQGEYIYCDYLLTKRPMVQVIDRDDEFTFLGDGVEEFGPLPEVGPAGASWNLKKTTAEPGGYYWVKNVRTYYSYSDGREPPAPTWVDTPMAFEWDITTETWEKRVFIGVRGSELKWEVWRHIRVHDKKGWPELEYTVNEYDTEVPGEPGVYLTTRIETRVPGVTAWLSYFNEQVYELIKSWSEVRKFIYKRGSGNATLDRLFGNNIDMGKFLPFIPFRIDNKMVPDMESELPPNTLTMSTKALKKAIGVKYTEVIKNIKKNESLKDIDYAYAMFGVSLNVVEKASREYIFTFFNDLRTRLPGGSHISYQDWIAQWNEANYRMQVWRRWFEGQRDPNDDMFGTREPPRGNYPVMPDFKVQVTSGNMPVLNYDMTVKWVGMDEISRRGQMKPGAKKGEIEIWKAGIERFPFVFQSEDNFYTGYRNIEKIQIAWQDTATTYRILSIWGLEHHNMIYRNKAVIIGAWEALDDKEESGFIIPLHKDLMKKMSLVKTTQMCTANSFLVFNCYQVVKKKWYQTGLFKMFLVIITIVVSIVFPPASGLLGTNLAVGTALGFTGLAATIVGAVANAVAAMLLTQIIGAVSTVVFGEKLGAIIGTIASIVAIQVGSNWVAGKDLLPNLGQFLRADKLLQLSMGGIDAMAKYLNADTMGIVQDTLDLMKQYEQTMEKIADAWDTIGGQGANNIIDPMQLTEAGSAYLRESPGDFLGRTQMLGSDVAEMSLAMVTKFTELTLQLP